MSLFFVACVFFFFLCVCVFVWSFFVLVTALVLPILIVLKFASGCGPRNHRLSHYQVRSCSLPHHALAWLGSVGKVPEPISVCGFPFARGHSSICLSRRGVLFLRTFSISFFFSSPSFSSFRKQSHDSDYYVAIFFVFVGEVSVRSRTT